MIKELCRWRPKAKFLMSAEKKRIIKCNKCHVSATINHSNSCDVFTTQFLVYFKIALKKISHVLKKEKKNELYSCIKAIMAIYSQSQK